MSREPLVRGRSQGFTLIELLFVMTILTVLGGMSVVAGGKMIEAGKRARCTSSLQQLGAATHLYLNDHNDRFFPYVSYGSQGRTWYFGHEPNSSGGGEGNRTIDQTGGPLWPYIESVGGIEICPSFPYEGGNAGLKFRTASFGYGYNWYLGGYFQGRPLAHAARISSAVNTILFADSGQIKPFGPGAGEKLEEFYLIDHRFATVHFRHGSGKANVLFVDGHVEPMTPHPGSLDPRATEIGEKVGLLAPSGSNDMLR